jgi:hypothetical protein
VQKSIVVDGATEGEEGVDLFTIDAFMEGLREEVSAVV